MNNLQKIASDITGYTHEETGACNSFYYNLLTEDEKLSFIQEYAFDVYDPIKRNEAETIYNFIELSHNGTNGWYYDFEALGGE